MHVHCGGTVATFHITRARALRGYRRHISCCKRQLREGYYGTCRLSSPLLQDIMARVGSPLRSCTWGLRQLCRQGRGPTGHDSKAAVRMSQPWQCLGIVCVQFSNHYSLLESNRPLNAILFKSLAIHLPFLSRYFCKSMPSSRRK